MMEYVKAGDFRIKKYRGRERNLKFIIEDKADEIPHTVKLLHGNNRITYEQINFRANSLANELLENGIGKGSHVAVMFSNCPEMIYSWVALSKIGAVCIPVNPTYKGKMLGYTLDHSDAIALLCHARYVDRLAPIKNELTKLEHLVVNSEGKEGNMGYSIPSCEMYSFKDMIEKGSKENPRVEVRDSDVMAISYTSGTTGDPKGCLQYQAQAYRFGFDSNICRCAEGVLKPKDVMLSILPLFHIAGLWIDFYGSIILDLPMATVEFSASRFWKDVRDYGATYCYFLGRMAGILLRTPENPLERNNSLRSCNYIPYNNEVELFKKRFGISDVATGWGLSEGHAAFAAVNPPKVTIGKQVTKEKGCVLLLDADEREVKIGEVGEICLRPDVDEPWELFGGYYKNPEETIRTNRNYMLHTGDMAFMDDEGYYIFVDRKKHAIRRGGENISSSQIEMCINSHAAVAESCVVGVPSDLSEDEIKAFIVVHERNTFKLQNLVVYLNENLPYFMVPRFYEIISSLPKTATEKIKKDDLKSVGLTGHEVDIKELGINLAK